MFKIEKLAEGNRTVLRLVGRINAERLDELSSLIVDAELKVAKLDMSEVTLVDVDAVRFLGDCQQRGIALCECPRYISEWIQREQPENSIQQPESQLAREEEGEHGHEANHD